MKLILDVELEVKVVLYDTEEERDANIIEMEKAGFIVKRKGQAYISTESTMSAYDDDNNWKPYAEFTKTREKFKTGENIRYESDMYWFSIYNPVKTSDETNRLIK